LVYSRKQYNLSNYDKIFKFYPNRQRYLKHRSVLEYGCRIGLEVPFPARICNSNPRFSVHENIGIGTQVNKWLNRGTVMGPIPKEEVINLGITMNRLFGVPKPNGDTRPILDNSDKTQVGHSLNDCFYAEVCTVEYAQTKEVVEIVSALGKNAWLWAKDLEDGYYNVTVHNSDIYNLGFVFDGKTCFYKITYGFIFITTYIHRIYAFSNLGDDK
jgi:hypothetical protein